MFKDFDCSESMTTLLNELGCQCVLDRVKAAETISELLFKVSSLNFHQETLNKAFKNNRNNNVKNLVDAMTSDEPYTKIEYSNVFNVSDFSKEDLDFINQGTKSGGFILVGSNSKEQLESSPESCCVGIWHTCTKEVIRLHTTFNRNRNGMPWGDYSFDSTPFKYVRFVKNPYGEIEFDRLPSMLFSF